MLSWRALVPKALRIFPDMFTGRMVSLERFNKAIALSLIVAVLASAKILLLGRNNVFISKTAVGTCSCPWGQDYNYMDWSIQSCQGRSRFVAACWRNRRSYSLRPSPPCFLTSCMTKHRYPHTCLIFSMLAFSNLWSEKVQNLHLYLAEQYNYPWQTVSYYTSSYILT